LVILQFDYDFFPAIQFGGFVRVFQRFTVRRFNGAATVDRWTQ
jgi:hypothetical protein